MEEKEQEEEEEGEGEGGATNKTMAAPLTREVVSNTTTHSIT